MKALILALGSHGDILPCALLGHHLQLQGHQVVFVTTEDFAPLLDKYDLDSHLIPGNAQEILHQAGANQIALMRAFADLSGKLTAVFRPEHTFWQDVDLVINQLPIGLYGYDVAEKLGVPLVLTAVIPLTRTNTFPAMSFPTALAQFPSYNQLTHRIYEFMTWRTLQKPINRWRQETLGLPPTPFAGYANQLYANKVLMLNGFSPHVVPPPPDWGDHVHTVGWWFPAESAWEPPAELSRFLEAGPPPVFLGFGSMPVKNPQRTTEIIVKGLQMSGQRAILHAGWGNIGQETLPDTIFRITYAPYRWLFPRMTAVLHHGGSGTTGFGLWSGTPSMTLPFLFDQYYWGQRMAELGVGPPPIPVRKLTPTRLAEAITTMTSDRDMRRKAAVLGQKIQAEDGLTNAVNLLEKLG